MSKTSPMPIPENTEAEQSLIGAMFANNTVFFHLIDQQCAVTPDMFFDPVNALVWDLSVQVIQSGNIANPVTLKNQCYSHEMFQGMTKSAVNEILVNLAASAVTVINATSYARSIREAYFRRELLKRADQMKKNAFNYDVELDAIVEDADAQVFAISEMVSRQSVIDSSLSSKMRTALARLQTAHQSAGLNGLTTGLRDLDDALGGLQEDDLIVIGGRPGMGKTGLITKLAMGAAKFLKKKKVAGVVALWSLEMSAEQIATRMAASESGINADRARKGDLKDEEFLKLASAGQQLSSLPIEIMDESDYTVSQIRSGARRIKRKHGLALIIIDYLQLIKTEGRKNDNRSVDVSEITRGLKMLAKETGVPVVALSQLSRAVEQREDKRPKLSDLRESGSIEQDADIVMFLFREAYYLQQSIKETNDPSKSFDLENKLNGVEHLAEVIIAKYRHGPLVTVPLKFEGEYVRFSDID